MLGFVIRFNSFILTLWAFRATVGSNAVFAPLALASLLVAPALGVPILALQHRACGLVHRCLGSAKTILGMVFLGIIVNRVGVGARFGMGSLAELEEAFSPSVGQERIDSLGEGQAILLIEN